ARLPLFNVLSITSVPHPLTKTFNGALFSKQSFDFGLFGHGDGTAGGVFGMDSANPFAFDASPLLRKKSSQQSIVPDSSWTLALLALSAATIFSLARAWPTRVLCRRL